MSLLLVRKIASINSSRQNIMFQNKTNTATSLEDALNSCRKAARHGYSIAKENLKETDKAIDGVFEILSKCLKSLEDGSVRTPEVVSHLKEQLSKVVNDLEGLQKNSNLDLKERRKRLDRFSITLFGRTMAGKSTLMEILTRGNGESIGTGAQRTTRDVRSYQWNSLEVTDVPGVAAFEGKEDEDIAFEAAKQADLILFLITDDAPQPAEAECLAQVRRLGKPVLGICNIKVAVDEDDDLRLFLHNPHRPFSASRLDQLLQQFYLLVDQHIPGKRVPFAVTHLRSRFLADQPGYKKHRENLIEASHFAGIETGIIKEVIGRGSFLRVKSFIDGSVAPMTVLADLLLEFSAKNSGDGRIYVGKERQLLAWKKKFETDGQERINTLISKAIDRLRDEVPSFVEDNYESRTAGKKWARLVESTGINQKVKTLQSELLDERNKEVSEVARELKSELSFVSILSSAHHITMDSIFNLKRVWNWVTGTVASGLGIAALFASGPPGWVAAAVGAGSAIISFFFDDREEKARKSRDKLTTRLSNDITILERNLQERLSNWFRHELLGKDLYAYIGDLIAVTSGLFDLADAQRKLAWTLNDRQKNLGRTLTKEALAQLAAKELQDAIIDVARVPGFATMFLIKPNTIFPDLVRNDLERLLGEHVWFVVDTQNPFSILTQAIGRNCDKKKVKIEERLRVAHVPFDGLDAVTKVRIKLAQQLTGYHVMQQTT